MLVIGLLVANGVNAGVISRRGVSLRRLRAISIGMVGSVGTAWHHAIECARTGLERISQAIDAPVRDCGLAVQECLKGGLISRQREEPVRAVGDVAEEMDPAEDDDMATDSDSNEESDSEYPYKPRSPKRAKTGGAISSSETLLLDASSEADISDQMGGTKNADGPAQHYLADNANAAQQMETSKEAICDTTYIFV